LAVIRPFGERKGVAPGFSPNRYAQGSSDIMDTATKTAYSKPTGSPMAAASQAGREMAEKGTTQARESYEKMTTATAEAADLIKNGYSTAVKGAHDYNKKLFEFAHLNTEVAFDFAQKLLGVKSPSDFIELSTEHARKQFETVSGQLKELAALGQQVTLATTEPLKTRISKAFSHSA
jgi:phasin